MQHLNVDKNQQRFNANINDIEMKMNKLDQEIYSYKEKLLHHPITKLCQEQKIPLNVLNEFAKIQFVDSILWVPMLALVKGKIRSPRLLKAVRANLLCEAGADGISHVTLCQNFIESLGILPRYGDYMSFSQYSFHPIEVMMGLHDADEAFIAGWLLAAEALVPVMFGIFKEAYQSLTNVDMTYFNEHIVIDADEHAQWMREAIYEILTIEDCFDKVMSGIDIGSRVALCIPDILYSKTIRLSK